MAGLGAVAARLVGTKKIIFTVHGWPFNEDRNIFSKIAIWFLSWITGLLSTHIINVSHNDFLQTHAMPFLRKKTSYIKNGIDTETAFLSREEARKLLFEKIEEQVPPPPTNPRFVIGTIAELTENKGLVYALDAVAKLRKKVKEDFVYIIIGDGEQRESLERRIRASA